MSQPLRCGLIGVGGVGKSHLNALETLEKEGLVRLVCVADPFVEKLAETKASLESKGVRWYVDFQKLLEQESGLEAIAICTPIPLHAKMGAAALARSLFVYLEKPPVPLIQQLNDLVALDSRHKVAVGFQYISSPFIQQLKKWKMEGDLGNIKSIHAYGALPRLTSYYQRASWVGKMQVNDEAVFDGPGTNALSHVLHNIMFLGGETYEGFDVPSEVEGELYRARPIESYDTLSMRGHLKSGIHFYFAVSHATEEHRGFYLEILGTKGKAWISKSGDEIGNDCGLINPVAPLQSPFIQSYRDFVDYAKGRRSRAVTRLEDTLGYVLATNAALLASGGIHHIGSEYWKIYTSGNEEGYQVAGLVDLLEDSVKKGKLFSEMGIPWARKGHSVLARSLRSVKLKDYISY